MMARVKIVEVLEHLDHDLKRAMEDAVRAALPEAEIDRNVLFREFLKSVRRKCSDWETVPNHAVQAD